MHKHPKIGLSGSIIVETDGPFPGYRRSFVNEDYIQSVLRAGGLPVNLPIISSLELVPEMLEGLDGLILTGGHDVNPLCYGQEPHPLLSEILPERDAFDAALLKYAEAMHIPVLGICRGLQMINVHYGGTLFQDNSLMPHCEIKHAQGHSPTVATHTISTHPGSFVASILGAEALVNSFHHQSIDQVATGFQVTAQAKDGIIEAIERLEGHWCVAVQFHPEMMSRVSPPMQGIFDAFVGHCRR